jgi:hypothetical protein
MKLIKTFLTCLLFVGMFQHLVAQTPGAPYFVPTGSVSSNGTAVISAFTCTTASAGTITTGTPVSAVTQTITATVASAGTYSISATANGVTFSGSGTLTSAASQTIVLTASGTPTAPGTAVSFTLNTTPSCSFTRNILSGSTNGSAIVSSFTCATASAGTLTAGTAVSGVTQTITATVTSAGTYNISTTTANGVTFSGTGTLTSAASQTIVLTASGTPTTAGTFAYTLNTTPNCSFNRTAAPQALPANITLSAVSDFYIASIFDQDYLPYTAPTGAAELPSEPSSEAANGVNETNTINIQGTLTTTGVTIKIPYTVTIASVNLPAYSQTINIPATYTEDGISQDVTFSYTARSLGVGTGTFLATLKTVGGTLNVKKLDLQTGIGNDYLGVLVAQFSYSTNNSGGFSNFKIRAVAGILDKRFGKPDNSSNSTTHLMIYLPKVAEDNEIWLNNNLGADYANINKTSFNPAQQATSETDFNGYGSLFQWGRFPDGHELINYTSATAGTSAYGTTSLVNSNNPTHAAFITTSATPNNWRLSLDDTLWATETSINNPCPVGFRVPTKIEYLDLATAANIFSSTGAANSALKFTSASSRDNTGGLTGIGNDGFYWVNSVSGNNAENRRFLAASTGLSNNFRSTGQSVRCIKD